MRWEVEKWRKLYRRVDASWLRLPLLARGLGSELLKYAEDDGRIAVMADEETGEAICRLLSSHKTERKMVAELAAKLVADGYLVRELDALFIRNFAAAQSRSSSAERQARYRARHSDVTGNVTGGVTSNASRYASRNGGSDATVTSRGDGSRSLSISSEISGSLVADPKEVSDNARPRPPAPAPADARDSKRRAKKATGQADLFGDAPPPKRRAKRGIPADWAPKPAAFAIGRGLGFDDARIRDEAARFADDAHSEGRMHVLWDPAFHNWLRNARKFERERAASRPGTAAPAPAAQKPRVFVPRDDPSAKPMPAALRGVLGSFGDGGEQ